MANWWEAPGYDMSRDAVVRGGVRPPDAAPGWWDEMLGPDRWSPSRGLAMPGEGVATVTIGEPPPREPWPVRFAGDMWETAKALPGIMIDAATLPGDVMAGRVDPNSDEALARANDLAGVVTLGAGAVPGGGLRAGAKIAKAAPAGVKVIDNPTIERRIAGSGFTSEDFELRPGAMESYRAPAMLWKGKVYEGGLGDNHATIAERYGFPSDMTPGFVTKNGEFHYQFADDLPDILTAGGPSGRVAGAAELAGPETDEPIDWRALTDWLAEQPGAVSRDALAEAAERYSTGDIPRRADGGRASKFRERIMKTGRPSKNVQDMRASQAAKINIAGKGNRELSRADMLRELMRPESIVDRPPDDLHGGWPWPSPEWQGGMYPRQDQIYPAVPSGLIRDATPGRTDRLPMSLPSDTYVVPADVVSGLGQGNTEAGGRLLDAMFRDHKAAGGRLRASGGRASSSPVQIIAAGGEYLIDPEVVYSLGKGDPDKGHKELDKWVRATRQRVVNHLTKLPGPRKD